MWHFAFYIWQQVYWESQSVILFFRKVGIWIGELFTSREWKLFAFFIGVLKCFLILFGTLNFHLFLFSPALKSVHSPIWKASMTFNVHFQKHFTFTWSLISKMCLSFCLSWVIYPWINETRSMCRKQGNCHPQWLQVFSLIQVNLSKSLWISIFLNVA